MGHQGPWSCGKAALMVQPPTRCCVTHDCCYDRLKKRGCGTKVLKYKFKYRAGKVVCEGKKEPCNPIQFPSCICSLTIVPCTVLDTRARDTEGHCHCLEKNARKLRSQSDTESGRK